MRRYLSYPIEDEELMLEWLKILESWQGNERAKDDFKGGWDEKLKETELTD